MKKATNVVCLILFISLTIIFASCTNATKHEHTFSDEWSSDSYSHWHSATCEHSDLKKDEKGHTFGDWIEVKAATLQSKGLKKRVCNICGYELFESIACHTHSYTENHDETKDWQECSCGDISNEENHIFGAWTLIQEPTETSVGIREKIPCLKIVKL